MSESYVVQALPAPSQEATSQHSDQRSLAIVSPSQPPAAVQTTNQLEPLENPLPFNFKAIVEGLPREVQVVQFNNNQMFTPDQDLEDMRAEAERTG